MKVTAAPSWGSLQLGKIAAIDRNTLSADAIPSGVKYVGLEHMDNAGSLAGINPVSSGDIASTKFSFDAEHILYGKLRPYLRKVARPNFSGICSTDILPIRPGPKVDRDYLFHWLRHPITVAMATSRSSGANLPRISPKVLRTFEVPIPFRSDVEKSLREQRRIASILEVAFKIVQKRAMVFDEILDLKMSWFESLFSKWLAGPISEMPQLGNEPLAEVVSGVTKGRKFKDQVTLEVPYIRVANVQDGFLDLEEIKSIEVLPSDVETYRLIHGDVLMTEGGDFDKLGRGAMWETEVADCIHQNHVFRVRCDQDVLMPEYFECYIRTGLARAYFLKCAKKTSNLASINKTQLKALPVPIPPMGLQQRFAEQLREIKKLGEQQESANAEAEDLFNSLLQRAFSGQL